MTTQIETKFCAAIIDAFQANKRLAERAIAQVSDESLHVPLDEYTNSIAVNMKHIAGNLISRWTQFLTSDGEKPTRNRDSEFVDTFNTRQEVLDYWEEGWSCLFAELNALTARELHSSVVIRGETQDIPLAMSRSLGHTCYHIGQIVQLARHHAGDNWTTLTIPPGGSEQFNQENWGPSGKSHS